MQLYVSELDSNSLYQEIIPNRSSILVAIRPRLYVHGNPSGSIKLQILDQNNELIAESETLTISNIYSSVGSLGYYHGFVRFYVNAYLMKDTPYRIKLVGSGYTFSESAWVGWCSETENPKYTLSSSTGWGLDLEIWNRKP